MTAGVAVEALKACHGRPALTAVPTRKPFAPAPSITIEAPPIIGLLGRKRAGKDTAAARLVEAHGFTRYAFADALKRLALDVDPIVIPIDTVWGSARLREVVERAGWEGAKEYREVRRTLQALGVAVRSLDEDFWVRRVMSEISFSGKPAVVTDVRFENEARAILAAGGRLVRVIRPGQDESDNHVSETELTDFPTFAQLINDTDIATLHNRTDAMLSSLN